MVVVAQLVRASVCGTEGRGFESRLPPKTRVPVNTGTFLFFTILHDLHFKQTCKRNVSKK